MAQENAVSKQKPFYNYNKFRSTFSQILAVLIGNVIMLQFGMSISMSTAVNGVLMSQNQNSTQTFVLNSSEGSWYASLLLIAHPVGSILSSYIQDRFGRKSCFTLVALPQFVGWMSLYFANSSLLLYVSSTCLGIALGLSEAPILTYIGESIEPRLRSGLSSFTVFCAMIGLFLTFAVTATLSWRQTALVYSTLPLFVFIVTIFVIPESPVWLLSRHRTKEATKALCWLRGFTSESAVRDELDYMVEFAKRRMENQDTLPVKSAGKRRCPESLQNLIDILTDKGILYSFIMFSIVFMICTISAMLPAKPFYRNIMDRIGLEGLPFDSSKALVKYIKLNRMATTTQLRDFVYSGAGTLLGAFLNMFTVKYTGKRPLLIFSIFISSGCQLALAVYAMGYLKSIVDSAWVPFGLFCSISFIAGYGITPIPWILLGEIFPMKSRGILSGVTAALNSIAAFFLTKTYWDVADFVSLPVTLMLYAAVGFVGIPYIFLNLPDTENKTLQQIQNDLKKSKTKNSGAELLPQP